MSDTFPTSDPLALLEHRAWVRALARRLVADENTVDDVEQDTWTAALRSGPDDPRALRPWLGRVASRFALQRLRGEGRRARRQTAAAIAGDDASGAGPAGARSPADVVAEADAHGHVVQAVLALDEPYRTTILLRYFEGLAIADVAARMEVPVETVRTRLRRAHDQLRARLERDHGRSAWALLAPLAAAAAGTSSAPAGFGLGVALGGSALLVAGIVGAVALGGWALGRMSAPGAGAAAGAVLPQQVPPPAPQAPAEPEQQAPPPPPAPVDERCVVRDLWDGKALAGVDLTIRRVDANGRAFWFEIATDADGRIPVKVLTGDFVKVQSKGDHRHWSHGIVKKADAPVPREIWIARMAKVRGRVHAADASDPWKPERVGVRAELTPVGSHWSCLPAGFPELGTEFFDSKRLLRTVTTATSAAGTFEMEVPLISGAVIQASARGRISMVEPLTDAVDLDFALRPAIRLHGRLQDASGAPLPGRKLWLLATDTTRDGSMPVWSNRDSPAAYKLPGGRTLLRLDAQTSADGRFEFEVADTWDVTVDLMETGLRRVVRTLGKVARDQDLEMAAVPATATERGTVRVGGAASGTAVLRVGERLETGRAWTLTLDADGRFDASWFVHGRDYELRLFRPAEGEPWACRPETAENSPRLVRWTGGDLDWEKLALVEAKTPGAAK